MSPIFAGGIRFPSALTRVSGNRVVIVRKYHDESFGFRKPREFTIADCAYTVSHEHFRTLILQQIPLTS